MSDRTVRFLLFLAGLAIYLPFLGSVHLFDWDEINFAECAREMLVTGDWLRVHIDFAPFYEKPPLFIWLQALSMLVFGVNEFAARLPNALVASLTFVVVYSVGQRVASRRFGLLWAGLYGGSLLPTFYGHTGIIDPLFNLFIFLSVLAALRAGRQGPLSKDTILSGLWAGLAVLTKGPVGLGLVLLTAALAFALRHRSIRLPWASAGIIVVVAAILPGIWVGAEVLANGPQFVQENLAYQWRLLTMGEAGHEQPWYYHAVVLMIGCFPASALLWGGLGRRAEETDGQAELRIWMTVLAAVVLVVFSIVKTKIVHYSSMTYLPLTFLAALACERLAQRQACIRWPVWVGLGLVCTMLTIAAASVPLIGLSADSLLATPAFKDVFLRAALQQPVHWSLWDIVPAMFLPTGLVIAFVLRKNILASVTSLAAGVLFFSVTFLPVVAPKIERIQQGAMIDYYRSLSGKDVYVKPLQMKSYAHLFYTNKPAHLSYTSHGIDRDAWEPWLIEGAVDRPVRLLARVNDAERWRRDARLRVIHEAGGYVVFARRDQRSALDDAALARPKP